MSQILKAFTFLVILASTLSSCVQQRDLLYFRDDVDVERQIMDLDSIQNLTALRLQDNDVLSITVHAFNPELAAPFNLIDSRSANSGGQNSSPFVTYQINENGEIDFPVLGAIVVKGLTVSEAKARINEKLKIYLKDPVVNMRLINFRISVLGEVNKPGTFIISNDRITVLEALGLAGDLTPYSNRQNLLVIREQNGIRQFGEIDIQKTGFLNSEFYYLKQGDVVYVEPRKDKEATVRDQFSEYLPWISVSLQAITTAISLIAVFGSN